MTELHTDIKEVEPSKLIPYNNNPKKHPESQVDKIASSIKNNGFVQPIVVDKSNEVIIGHGRLQASKKLGLDKVPVIKHESLSEAEVKALRLADNRIAESGWEEEQLAVELEQLTESDDFEDLIHGFNDDEISEYLDSLTDETDLEEPESEDPDQIDTDIQEGEIFKLGEHRLMCGDATNQEHVETLMDGEKAAITFTSPPYNAGESAELDGNKNRSDNKYTNYDDDKTQSDWRKLVQGTLDWAMKYSKYQFYNIQQLAGNKRAFIELLHENKNYFADVAIWDKQNAAPAMQPNVMDSRFEYVLIFSQEKNPSRAISTGNFRGQVHNVYEGSPQTNNEYSNVHAATFPIDFPNYFIKNFTQREDVVLDNFAGTGTTLLACEQTNRKAFCMELDPQYCQVIINRWEELTGKQHEVLEQV